MSQKRKQILVNPKIQFKLIILILIFAVLPIVGLFIGLFFYTSTLISQVPDGNQVLVEILEAIQRINFITFGGFLFVVTMLAFVETQFLHRIVGPLYRIEMDLEEILSTNNFQKQIHIRKDDYLQSLVVKINAVLMKLRDV